MWIRWNIENLNSIHSIFFEEEKNKKKNLKGSLQGQKGVIVYCDKEGVI